MKRGRKKMANEEAKKMTTKFRLTRHDYQVLKLQSKRLGISASEFIRRALHEHFAMVGRSDLIMRKEEI